ncbi:MAG: transcriptional repressor [Ruminococcaceae bacterium]|nr:transcriptional repressor [Oscillospiraceae bacterium]
MEKQIYKTKIKEKILQCFQENAENTFSAKDIHTTLSQSGEKVNITTVYRNLDTMTFDGVLIKFQDNKCEKAIYKYSGKEGNCRSHLHMKCVECGAVVHLNCHFMNEIRTHIKNEHGFSLICSNSVIYGICKNCENRENV